MSKFSEVTIDTKDYDIKDYQDLTPDIYKSILKEMGNIRDMPIIHVNATPIGGGVAEMLVSQIHLERTAGLDSRWLVIEDAPSEFFVITKKIHNLLQGKSGSLSKKEQELYLKVNRDLAKSLNEYLDSVKSGIVIIHDPQPLPVIKSIPDTFVPILRLHIDTSTPNPATLEFLRPYISEYPLVILSNEDYVKPMPWLKEKEVQIIYPAIDPFTDKNMVTDSKTCNLIIGQLGINRLKPIITQISRFDPWKDPVGVIHAYYMAKNKIPDLQLILAGLFFANDDPEALSMFEEVKKHSKGDPDIYLFSDPKKVLGSFSNNMFINALYTTSTVVIQKSLREGFGLTITEAMWKEKTVIAGKTSGALVQIEDDKNGVLVNSPEEAAEAIVDLVRNERLRTKLGKAAKETVKEKFLLPRLLLEHIKIYSRLCDGKMCKYPVL